MNDERHELPALPRFRSGDRVGDYVVEGVLDDGEKHVYRAREAAAPGRPVALKIVPIAALASVPEPSRTNDIANIVTTLAVGSDDQWRVGFVAMELIEGPSLAHCIETTAARGRRPTAAERRSWIEQLVPVAAGLHELHRRGVVHCDVKPHNIVIERRAGERPASGRAVLVDLGIARSQGVPAAQSTLMHAAAYSAPEQLLGQCIDGRTDVFAFGVTLYDVLLGQPATQRGVRPTLGLVPLDRIDPAIDSDLSAIVAECTSLVPADRYPDMRRLAADLERWLAGRRPMVRPRAPWRRMGRFIRRHPGSAARRALIVLVVAALSSIVTTVVVDEIERAGIWRECRAAILLGDLDRAATLVATGVVDSRLSELASADVESVLALLREGDKPGARRHASRLCSRDGLAAHPSFDRWFARLLRGDDASVRDDACRLLARVLYDHPRRPGEAMPAVAVPLLDIVGDDTTEASLFALTAAGGLADREMADRLVTAAERQAGRHDNGREYLRLLVEVLHRIAFESTAGQANALTIVQLERQMQRCMCLLQRAPAFADWSAVVLDSAPAWFETIRALRDAAGLPAPDPGPMLACWPGHPVIRSLARSPELIEELATGRWPPSISAFHLGRLVELAQPGVEAMARIRRAMANEGDLATPEAEAAFTAGRSFAAASVARRQSPWESDRGSRLADELAHPDAPVAWPTGSGSHRLSGSLLAGFDLQQSPVAGAGSIGKVTACLVRHEWDESLPPSAFGWFGSPGRSSLEFEFVEPARPQREMVVVIEEQKGQRGAFPYGGEAGLDMFLDGVFQASWRDLGGISGRVIPLALSGIEAGHRRRLMLRLRADANTTLRLYSVVIR